MKNEAVLSRMGGGERALMKEVQKTEVNWVEHIIKGRGILTAASEGSVQGERK